MFLLVDRELVGEAQPCVPPYNLKEMFKSILVLTLVGTFVSPSFSCSQLLTRTKVAAGESIIGQLDIVLSLLLLRHGTVCCRRLH